jgi:hypothetical protein
MKKLTLMAGTVENVESAGGIEKAAMRDIGRERHQTLDVTNRAYGIQAIVSVMSLTGVCDKPKHPCCSG